MGVSPNKALAEMTEKEVRGLLPVVSTNVSFSYNDIVNELERRRMKRESTRTFVLSIIAISVSALSLLASVLVALFSK